MKLLNLDSGKIILNSKQPRKKFDAERLEELSKSVREYGIIQPIIVRKIVSLNKYEIIAGERRFRASQMAGLDKVPAIEIASDNMRSFELAVLENVQRENLNSIEEAEAYSNLIEVYNYTQEELAEKLGKTRSAISNKLRLLQLPEKVKQMVRENSLSYGQARTLLAFKDKAQIEELSDEIVKKQYSVRELEIMAKRSRKKDQEEKAKDSGFDLQESSGEMEYLKSKLIEFFESKVEIKLLNENLGKLEIEFYGYEDLERILNILKLELE
jgi:ParB family chromosome partitioning protein